MNLKNFPKSLSSKTSCLRIAVPENLDLALEGLIRKVLKEQPKIDDIYAFAADYFDTLLKIRDKLGTKFQAEQVCPFHSDEDAYEMIKLANTFPKPEKFKTKTPKADNEPSKSTKKADTAIKNPKPLQKKPKQSAEKKREQKLNEIKPEKPEKLKLEPKTEDVGEDEDFLKSDPIKILVEKELMDAAKPRLKDRGEEGKTEENIPEIANEELCTVVDKTEETKSEETGNKAKEEEIKPLNADKDKEETAAGEKKSIEETEDKIENEMKEQRSAEEKREEKDTSEEMIKELQGSKENRSKPEKPEIQDFNLEIKSENDYTNIQEHLEKEVKAEAKNEDISDNEINQNTPKEETEDIKLGKSLEENAEGEGTKKDEEAQLINPETQAVLEEKEKVTEDALTAEEVNSEELCAVVDILSIKQIENVDTGQPEEAEVEEATPREEEVKTEVNEPSPEEEKEVVEIQKSIEAEKEEANVDKSPHVLHQNENIIPETVKITEKQQNSSDFTEEFEEKPGNNNLAMQENDTKKMENVSSENQSSAPTQQEEKEDNETTQTFNPALENLKESEKSEAKEEKEPEKQVEPEEKLTEVPERKEAAAAENENIKSAENNENEEEPQKPLESEISTEEAVEDNEKTEYGKGDSNKEEVNLTTNEEKPSNVEEEVQNVAKVPKQPETEKELELEEAGPKEVKREIDGTEKDGGVVDIVKKADRTVETVLKDSEKGEPLLSEESLKEVNELGESVASNAINQPEETEPEAPEVREVTDAQHVIKVEEAEPEPISHPEGVKIKTIQTHYYDTLQIPEQVTKEYRVHSVKNDNLLSIPEPFGEETPTAPLIAPKRELGMENFLMTPSSNFTLNFSELSPRAVSGMFLEKEKEFSSQDRDERRHASEMGGKCGGPERQEVEEIIHKTIIPPRAAPVASEEDNEINAKSEKRAESVDSSDPVDSLDSDTPVISVEVKTVIETQILEDEEAKGDGESGSEVEIKIETTIDVPEGVVVDLRQERETKDEVKEANDEASDSEAVQRNSQTFSGESESTVSSTGTEIKRSVSTQRPFSSTRTLIATQSLDLEKRNPPLKTRSLSSFRQGVTDFEVWSAIEKELEEAATKIQSNFRGYKTRKKLQRENAVHITTEESSCNTTPVEPEPESEAREERQQSTGEFHDSIVLSEHPR